MTDDAQDDGPGNRIREILAERDARDARWEAGEYPGAAYEAVRLLEQMDRKGWSADQWRIHAESVVRDEIAVDDSRSAEEIAAKLRPEMAKVPEPQALAKTIRRFTQGPSIPALSQKDSVLGASQIKPSSLGALNRLGNVAAGINRPGGLCGAINRPGGLYGALEANRFGKTYGATNRPNALAAAINRPASLAAAINRPNSLAAVLNRPNALAAAISRPNVLAGALFRRPLTSVQVARDLAPVAARVQRQYVEAEPERRAEIDATAQAAGVDGVLHEIVKGMVQATHETREAAEAFREAGKRRYGPMEWAMLLLTIYMALLMTFKPSELHHMLSTLLDLLANPPSPLD